MLKTSRRYIPALVVTFIVVCLFIVGATDLRYYFQEKMYTVMHIANTTNPVVSTVEERFSFDYNIERSNTYKGTLLSQMKGYNISIARILNVEFWQNEYEVSDTIDQIQACVRISVPVQKTDKGIGILSIVPLPDKKNFPKQISKEVSYEGPLDNITVSVGGQQFHPKQVKYMITQFYIGKGDNADIEFSIYLFQNPDDFMNYVIKPQNRTITVTVSKMYLHEYELNPILKGVF